MNSNCFNLNELLLFIWYVHMCFFAYISVSLAQECQRSLPNLLKLKLQTNVTCHVNAEGQATEFWPSTYYSSTSSRNSPKASKQSNKAASQGWVSSIYKHARFPEWDKSLIGVAVDLVVNQDIEEWSRHWGGYISLGLLFSFTSCSTALSFYYRKLEDGNRKWISHP